MIFGGLFGLRSRPKKKPITNHYRPMLDVLENRLCPSAGPPGGGTIQMPPPALSIVFDAQVQPGKLAQISGQVQGMQVSNVEVAFTGAYVGNVTTDANGYFSLVTNTASLGMVYANTPGADQAEAAIAKELPGFANVQINYGTQKNVTVTGTLLDLDAAGRTIYFPGAATGTPVAHWPGNFSFSTTTASLGNLTLSVQDLWGQTGFANGTISSNAPVIEDFSFVPLFGTLMQIEGRVIDESSPGLIVRFGGLEALQGLQATVNSEGRFVLEVDLAGASGVATAITTDWWGLDSHEVSFLIV